jgi:hypothetical protein
VILFTQPSFAPLGLALALALSFARPVGAAVCVAAAVRQTGLPMNPLILEAMKDEAAAIWTQYGVAIRWADDPANPDRCRSADSSVAVQVDNAPRRHWTARSLTLGTTLVSIRRAGPVPIRLDYAAIDRLLGSLTADTLGHVVGRQQLTPSDVGRALGRVLAHEVGHVLLAGSGHRRKGLMRASFVPSELVDYRRRTYTLSAADIERIGGRTGHAGETPGASMTDD